MPLVLVAAGLAGCTTPQAPVEIYAGSTGPASAVYEPLPTALPAPPADAYTSGSRYPSYPSPTYNTPGRAPAAPAGTAYAALPPQPSALPSYPAYPQGAAPRSQPVGRNPVEPLIIGIARVTDGDTLLVGDTRVRLDAVDAPEMAQQCIGGPVGTGPCGEMVADAIKRRIEGQSLTCIEKEKDRYGRSIARCTTPDGADLSRWLVAMGYGMAYRQYSTALVPDEEAARAQRRGLWQTNWQAPWDFRSGRWQQTERQAPRQATSQVTAQVEGCPIKGNINSKGDRIYHTPWGSPHYNRTVVSTASGERWFCSESEAVAAGWRAPYR